MGRRRHSPRRAPLLAFGLIAIAAFSTSAEETLAETAVSVSIFPPTELHGTLTDVAVIQVATAQTAETPIPAAAASDQVGL